MKRNEIKALAQKSPAELQAQLEQLQSEVAKARQAKRTGKLSNVRQLSTNRYDVARIKTILAEQAKAAKA
jgi:large subunit ribosomal protein L29